MTPQQAYDKCLINNKRDKDLEPFIIKDPHYAYFYALNIIEGRWIEAEQYIMKNPHYAYFYAKNMIRGRWIEAEQYIMKRPGYSYYYALFVIQGKLPESMHNAMIAYGIDDTSNNFVKDYIKYIHPLTT
jgi:hypothetical protein